MHVRRIEDPHAKKVAEVLEAMLVRAKAGRVPSLLVIMEEGGSSKPRYCVVGRFRADPARALGHVTVMREKLTELAFDQAPEIEEDEG